MSAMAVHAGKGWHRFGSLLRKKDTLRTCWGITISSSVGVHCGAGCLAGRHTSVLC